MQIFWKFTSKSALNGIQKGLIFCCFSHFLAIPLTLNSCRVAKNHLRHMLFMVGFLGDRPPPHLRDESPPFIFSESPPLPYWERGGGLSWKFYESTPPFTLWEPSTLSQILREVGTLSFWEGQGVSQLYAKVRVSHNREGLGCLIIWKGGDSHKVVRDTTSLILCKTPTLS